MAGRPSNLTFIGAYLQYDTNNTKDVILSRSYYFRMDCLHY